MEIGRRAELVSFIDKNVIGAAVLLVGTVAGLLELGRFPPEARPFPALVLATLLTTGIWWLARSLLARPTPGSDTGSVGDKRRLIAATGLTLAYAVAVSHLSYFIPTVLYIPAMAVALGDRRPLIAGLAGVGFTLGAYVIFVVLFERPIPLL